MTTRSDRDLPPPYDRGRARQLRMMLYAVLASATVMVILAVALLIHTGDDASTGVVLLVVLVPALVLLGLSVRTLALLALADRRVKMWVTASGTAAILDGLLLTRVGVGWVLIVVGVLLVLVGALPGRDPDTGRTSG
ncbi:hypothetical protein FB382_001160 [Nocardioides ginsengisegetis]|uniref:Uncharacterized protein n=1 Tax=Nocardioides ginsengisegetis TaxID=661491 RepID=A0A7W3IYJ1_9ACTN|nr:hypothetical protein [Nocardioides ginsengisegetis]MBA8802869.1 hypothetical protein [Nocardioides ginsengisegetis]